MTRIDVTVNAVMNKIAKLQARKEAIETQMENTLYESVSYSKLSDKVKHIELRTKILKEYLNDLKDIKAFETDGIHIRCLSKGVYHNYISNADISEEEVSGDHCELCRISKFPLDDVYICWLTPIKHF